MAVQNFLAGILFLAMGLVFLAVGLDYPTGSFSRMGPGMFPLIVSSLTIVCSLGLIITSLRTINFQMLMPSRLRREGFVVLVITIAVVSFGVLVESYGLFPATAALVGIACLAGEKRSIAAGGTIAIALAALTVIIFIYGLNIPLKMGPF